MRYLSMFFVIVLSACSSAQMSLLDMHKAISQKKFVDLTHSFAPGIPHHPLLPDEEREKLFDYDDGFVVEQFTHVGQWGTHVDPPSHFVEGLRSLDAIPVKEMILPLVVFDVHEKVESNPDYTITMDDVRDWEHRYGLVPAGSFAAMRTDWSQRWPDSDAMQNYDEEGIKHYPGWSREVLEYLFEERDIMAIGHETTDTDPGLATSQNDYSLEYYVLAQDHYQIEMLANLDQVPQYGALIVASWPKPEEGSGFPARVFAILP